MSGSATSLVSSPGWDALRAGDWSKARVAFEAELATTETTVALIGLTQARWWMSDIAGAVEGRPGSVLPPFD